MVSAKEMFLDLSVPREDPLGLAKIRVSNAAPGVKLSETKDGVEWYSDFIYLVVVNEEDGLEFRVSQTVDGGRELQTLWKETELQDPSTLGDILRRNPLWDVYQLRAVVLIQQRVEKQIISLINTQDVESFEYGEDKAIRKRPRGLAVRLRQLEMRLLEMANESLEKEVCSPLVSMGDLFTLTRDARNWPLSKQMSYRSTCLHPWSKKSWKKTSRSHTEPLLDNTSVQERNVNFGHVVQLVSSWSCPPPRSPLAVEVQYLRRLHIACFRTIGLRGYGD